MAKTAVATLQTVWECRWSQPDLQLARADKNPAAEVDLGLRSNWSTRERRRGPMRELPLLGTYRLSSELAR